MVGHLEANPCENGHESAVSVDVSDEATPGVSNHRESRPGEELGERLDSKPHESAHGRLVSRESGWTGFPSY